jgi:peptide/nickel transport system permease protein
MTAYIIRRSLYAVPILVGVNVLVFLLFFFVNSPADMARAHLGQKRVTPEQIEAWKRERQLHLPYFYNVGWRRPGSLAGSEPQVSLSVLARFTETIFFQRSVKILLFQYGKSDDGKDIGAEIYKRIGPSLSITVPAFGLGLFLDVVCAMGIAFYRGTYVDYWGLIVCVILMSISALFYIMGGQVVLGQLWRLVPISGFDYGPYGLKFIALPVLIAIVAGLGGSVRFYRTIFLEEMQRDYVRTARAKGLSEGSVLFLHALKNALIPILTGVVVRLPFLFAGSLLLESFFAIPGMGSGSVANYRK